VWVALGVAAERRQAARELVGEDAAEPVQTRLVEVVAVGETLERRLLGHVVALVLLEEVLEALGGDAARVEVVEPEVAPPVDVHDVADDHERHLLDGALAPELREVDLAHDAEGDVALPRRHVHRVAQRLRRPQAVEVVRPPAVAPVAVWRSSWRRRTLSERSASR